MKSIYLIIFFYLWSVFCQINFIPTTYTTKEPPFVSPNGKNSYKLFICKSDVYLGCRVTFTVNLPTAAWSYDGGSYVAFEVYNEKDSCSNLVCKNIPEATNSSKDSCTTTYSVNHSNFFFIDVYGPPTSGITFTMDVQFNCSKKSNYIEEKKTYSKLVNECPSNPNLLREIIRLNQEGNVRTGYNTADFARYSFIACGDGKNRIDVTESTSTEDDKSAFMTYICDNSNCNVHTHNGWYDPFASGLNNIHFQTSDTNPISLWLTVVGLGKYNQFNSFKINVNVKSN